MPGAARPDAGHEEESHYADQGEAGMSAQDAKEVRARRLAATATARRKQRDITEQQAAAKAAQAAIPHDRSTVARVRDQRRYLVGDYVHRVTGSRIRLLDTLAPDAPRGAFPPEAGPGGRTLRYAVLCLDHGTFPRYFALLREAERAVRQSAGWCPGCAELLAA